MKPPGPATEPALSSRCRGQHRVQGEFGVGEGLADLRQLNAGDADQRDHQLMTELHDELPAYEWARNKGYASPDHREAIRMHGISRHHRASWSIADAPTLF